MKETVIRKYNELIERKNEKRDFYNGIYERWKYPVLTDRRFYGTDLRHGIYGYVGCRRRF